MFITKMFVFALTFAFSGFVTFAGGMFLFDKLVAPMDNITSESHPWNRAQNILFFCVLVTAVLISLTMACVMVGEVHGDVNPWTEDVVPDQTYPY